MRATIVSIWVCLGVILLPAASAARPRTPEEREQLALQREARAVPDTVRAIIGRVERNPPLYYEMRLKQIQREVETTPGKLQLYEDAAEACDKLGRDEDAIRWLERKREILDRVDPLGTRVVSQRFRYYANSGFYWTHRWIREGADRGRPEMLRAALSCLDRAIRYNRQGDVTREEALRMVIDWMLDPNDPTGGRQMLPLAVVMHTRTSDITGIVRGLTHLIMTDILWETVDIVNALGAALESVPLRRVACLARLRYSEMIDQGRISFLPDAPTGGELKSLLEVHRTPSSGSSSSAVIESYYRLRREADLWQERRTHFMLARLERGRNPDRDETFWKGFADRGSPLIVTNTGGRARPSRLVPLGIWAGASLLLLSILALARRRIPMAGPDAVNSLSSTDLSKRVDP